MRTRILSVIITWGLLCTASSCFAALGDSLLAYWTFDDGTGTTVTDYLGGADGTINGGVTWSTGADAKYGSGLSFDGNYLSKVALPTTGSLCSPGNAISFSVWLKATEPVDTITTSYRSIFNSNSGQDYYILYYDKANAQLRMKVTSTNSAITRVGVAAADVPVNTWYHFGAVYDGTNATLYINGVQKATLTGAAGTLKSPQAHAIGAKGANGDQNWKGAMDDLAIWNRALRADEMQFLATTNKPVKDVLSHTDAHGWELLH